ncbi:MAG: hypothetical protein NWR21_13925 [Verrucomicrobiales bacterium]|nr:hypothetical protein [Verrucomicrobiales bacterium]
MKENRAGNIACRKGSPEGGRAVTAKRIGMPDRSDRRAANNSTSGSFG